MSEYKHTELVNHAADLMREILRSRLQYERDSVEMQQVAVMAAAQLLADLVLEMYVKVPSEELLTKHLQMIPMHLPARAAVARAFLKATGG